MTNSNKNITKLKTKLRGRGWGKEIQKRVEEKYNVTYSLIWIYRVLDPAFPNYTNDKIITVALEYIEEKNNLNNKLNNL